MTINKAYNCYIRFSSDANICIKSLLIFDLFFIFYLHRIGSFSREDVILNDPQQEDVERE